MKNDKKTTLIPILTILFLMVLSYGLTLAVPCEGIKLWQWVLSPFLVLGSDAGALTIAILVFLLVISGISNVLDKCGFMSYMLGKIAYKYAGKRYKFMALFVLFLMCMGSFIGSFEEVVPIVPLCVILAKKFGFDDYIGLGMSLLAVGCGFSAGIANPFTVGIAQQLCELPMFSGAGLRILSFVLIYGLLMGFLTLYSKKHAVPVNFDSAEEFQIDPIKDKALKAFAIIMGACLVLTISSSFLTFLQDYTIIIIALGFLTSGIVAASICGMKGKPFANCMGQGVKLMVPSLGLILMASSIRYILDTSGCLNYLVQVLCDKAGSFGKIQLILFIYVVVLVFNMFIPSGSAKAMLLIPLIVPVAQSLGLSAQICVLAYAFGDGFSNIFYPTNPALIISLGLINMDYKDWFKFSWKFQLPNFVLTSLILILGVTIGY